MAIEPGYPVTMTHPQHRAARVAIDNAKAEPEKFPQVTVNGSAHEEQYRAQGYLRHGEPQKIMKDHYEYPKMMRHPDHVPGKESYMEAKIEDGRITGTFRVPTVPAYLPDVTANSLEEEQLWEEKGYEPAGKYNPTALQAVLNHTVDEEEYDPDEYPKWVNGTLVSRDPDAPEELVPTPEYPRWENGVLVLDPRFPQVPDPAKYPMWIHKDNKPSKDSVLVKNPSEEFEARKKFAPKEETVQIQAPIVRGKAKTEDNTVAVG